MIDPWVPVLRSIQGNDVVRTVEEVGWYDDPAAFHVVIVRESAISGEFSQSLDGLPDSDTVAHWREGPIPGGELRRRFDQAVAMAVGLNEWEALQ